MEVYYCKTKLGGSILYYPLACFAMLILILLNASCCGGGTVGILVKSNATNFGCDGRLEECLILEDDLEIELLVNPCISRMLADGENTGSNASKDSERAYTCGQKNDLPQNSQCTGQSSRQGNNNPCPLKSAYARYKCP